MFQSFESQSSPLFVVCTIQVESLRQLGRVLPRLEKDCVGPFSFGFFIGQNRRP
jgi:hypothetical protein